MFVRVVETNKQGAPVWRRVGSGDRGNVAEKKSRGFPSSGVVRDVVADGGAAGVGDRRELQEMVIEENCRDVWSVARITQSDRHHVPTKRGCASQLSTKLPAL